MQVVECGDITLDASVWTPRCVGPKQVEAGADFAESFRATTQGRAFLTQFGTENTATQATATSATCDYTKVSRYGQSCRRLRMAMPRHHGDDIRWPLSRRKPPEVDVTWWSWQIAFCYVQ